MSTACSFSDVLVTSSQADNLTNSNKHSYTKHLFGDLKVGWYTSQWGQPAGGQSEIPRRAAQFFDSMGELIIYQNPFCSLTATVTCDLNGLLLSEMQMFWWGDVCFGSHSPRWHARKPKAGVRSCLKTRGTSRRLIHFQFQKNQKHVCFNVILGCLNESFVSRGSFVCCWWSVKAIRPLLCKEPDNPIIKP